MGRRGVPTGGYLEEFHKKQTIEKDDFMIIANNGETTFRKSLSNSSEDFNNSCVLCLIDCGRVVGE